MPLQQTSGNVTADAYGGGVAAIPNYIEDVFSTWLYTGNGSTQTITNGIDLSTYGGLVWIKARSGTFAHRLTDTARGATKELVSNAVTIEATVANSLTAFNSTGFALGSDIYYNNNTSTYASWTFREQPKFFDVVTYTGNSVSGRAIPHNLGSAPGCVIIKTINDTQNWAVWHRSGSQSNTDGAYLNTSATYSNKAIELWGPDPGTPNMNATTFSVGGNIITNENGQAYVAYLFAHNAGGFGLAGTDNVISCGSFTATGNDNVTLNYEPQWVMAKQTDGSGNWIIFDNMRGMPVSANTYTLVPNTSGAETNTAVQGLTPIATGFNNQWFGGSTNIIYIAIRRGPMKVPTLGTSVYNGVTRTGTGAAASITTVGFPPDLVIGQGRSGSGHAFEDKLRGYTQNLESVNTSAESTSAAGEDVTGWLNNGITVGIPSNSNINASGVSTIGWYMQRAPSFFDEVCYTGDSSTPRSLNHNLAAVPELIIIKKRSSTGEWFIYSNFTSTSFKYANFNTSSFTSRLYTDVAEGLSSQPTSTALNLDDSGRTNGSGITYVAYLFSTCAGVSKVGLYTGNGSTQTIDCGFTGGARFVLIKRQDASGGWYVYDTARGMTVLTDPYLFLNNTAAEVATLGSVTTVSTGFALNSSILAAINVNAGSYLFLAIA